MKKLLVLILLFISIQCYSEDLHKYLKEYTEFKYQQPDSYSTNLELKLPYNIDLVLNKVHIDPKLLGTIELIDTQIQHYQGYKCSISMYKDQISGLIITDSCTYVIGKLDSSENTIIYKQEDLLEQNPFKCYATEFYEEDQKRVLNNTVTNKCVSFYYETDYDIWLQKQGTQNTIFYITSVFNQVQMLYLNDGINISLKTLYINETQDNYTGPGTSDYLNQFGNNRTSFDGDLAVLIGYPAIGGIAYVDVLCIGSPFVKMAFCGISPTFNNIPLYSWTVEVITHEQGHLLGSNHTHDCVWNSNNTRIDDCGTHAGAGTVGLCGPDIPDPTIGGTIMSYCHLRTVGINFNLGFGIQPKTIITNRINNASCLSTTCTCSSPQVPGTIQGPDLVYKGQTNQLFSTNNVQGATSYHWVLPPNSTGTSNTTSILVNFDLLYAGGNICIQAINNCGSTDNCKTVQAYTQDVLSIQEIKRDYKRGEIRVFDTLGREYKDLNNLSNGIYFIRKNNQCTKILYNEIYE